MSRKKPKKDAKVRAKAKAAAAAPVRPKLVFASARERKVCLDRAVEIVGRRVYAGEIAFDVVTMRAALLQTMIDMRELYRMALEFVS